MTSPKPIKTATQNIKIVVAHFIANESAADTGRGIPVSAIFN
jgi:hypothetical protein